MKLGKKKKQNVGNEIQADVLHMSVHFSILFTFVWLKNFHIKMFKINIDHVAPKGMHYTIVSTDRAAALQNYSKSQARCKAEKILCYSLDTGFPSLISHWTSAFKQVIVLFCISVSWGLTWKSSCIIKRLN